MKILGIGSWRLLWSLLAIAFVAAVAYCANDATRLKQWLALGRLEVGSEVHAGEEGSSGESHDHATEVPKNSLTIWGKNIEAFLEHPHPVVGQPVDLLVHLTVIVNGSPVTEGELTLHITGGNQPPLTVILDRPARPGLFLPTVTFAAAGTYQASLNIKSSQINGGSETISLPPMDVFGNDEAVSRLASQEAPGDAIPFLKEQQWRVGVTTLEVREQAIVERLVVPGKVVVPPGSGAAVCASIGGKICPPDNRGFVQVGDLVQQGQVLAIVEPSIAGAEAVQLVSNQAQLKTLDADLVTKQLEIESEIRSTELTVARATELLQRKQSLSQQGITPGKDVLQAEHDLAMCKERLAGLMELRRPYVDAREQVATVLDRLQPAKSEGAQPGELQVTLRSPLQGTVVEVDAAAGEFVEGQRTLFRIVNLDRLWIEAHVSEYDLARVQQAPGASYRLAAYPDQVVPILERGGRLVNIGVEVDGDTRTLPIRYEVANPDGVLRVGMFADLLVETQRRAATLAVPKSCLMEEAGETVVYVQHSGETFQRRRVDVGICDAELVEIRRGLQAGERVATKGVYSIRLATLSKQSIGHGHAH